MTAYTRRREEAEKAARLETLVDRANRLLVNVERTRARQAADTLIAAQELRDLLGQNP